MTSKKPVIGRIACFTCGTVKKLVDYKLSTPRSTKESVLFANQTCDACTVKARDIAAAQVIDCRTDADNFVVKTLAQSTHCEPFDRYSVQLGWVR